MTKPHLFTSARNARDLLLRPETLSRAGQTPFRVIHDDGMIRVRYYPPLESREVELAGERVSVTSGALRTPLVIVPPLAVNMLIYDLFPERSLVRYLRARGIEVYLVDWGRPDSRHDHYRLSTYFDELLPEKLEHIREHAGTRRLYLHGWSFGGLFSLCYAALHEDPDLAGLVLVGAPCDYHHEGALGQQYRRISARLRRLRRWTGLRVRRMPRRLFHSPGWANSLGFKLLTPVSSLSSYLELARNLGDRDYVREYATNAAFLEDMVAYPGGIMQDVIHFLLVDNVLARGELPVRDADRGLERVGQPVLSITGANDPIVPPEASHRMFDFISSEDVQRVTVPGGHMGVLAGSRGAMESWPVMAEWLAARD